MMETSELTPKRVICAIHLHLEKTVALNNHLNHFVTTCFSQPDCNTSSGQSGALVSLFLVE